MVEYNCSEVPVTGGEFTQCQLELAVGGVVSSVLKEYSISLLTQVEGSESTSTAQFIITDSRSKSTHHLLVSGTFVL